MSAVTDCQACQLRCRPLFVPMTTDEIAFMSRFKSGEAFAAPERAKGSPGMHVVTGQGMRNVGFYRRNGFEEIAEAPWNGQTVVMLGRRLS